MDSSLIMYILAVNLITFYLMRVDKQKAIKGHYRIPERTFFLLSILGGALGTYIGMKAFRHKTKHKRFTIVMPLFMLIHIIMFVYFWGKV